MAGINLSFVSDVRGFLTGTRDAERGLDRVGDSLDDVARDGEQATGKLERTFRQDFDKVVDHAQDAGRKIERATRDGTDKGGQAVGEFKSEAQQNFSEVASSFSGDMSSASDMVQGTLGGLAGSIGGPAGLAAGMAGALVGVGVSMFSSTDENAEKAEERISAMYQDMMESGLAYLSDSAVLDGISAIVTGAEDAAVSMSDARGYAEDLGIDLETVVAAFAGSPRAINDMVAAIEAAKVPLREARDAAVAATDDIYLQTNANTDLGDALIPLAAIEDALGRVSGEIDTARGNLDLATAAGERYTETGQRAAEVHERDRDAVRDIQDRYRALEQQTFAPKTITLRADTTALDAELARPRTIRVGVMARPGVVQVV